MARNGGQEDDPFAYFSKAAASLRTRGGKKPVGSMGGVSRMNHKRNRGQKALNLSEKEGLPVSMKQNLVRSRADKNMSKSTARARSPKSNAAIVVPFSSQSFSEHVGDLKNCSSSISSGSMTETTVSSSQLSSAHCREEISNLKTELRQALEEEEEVISVERELRREKKDLVSQLDCAHGENETILAKLEMLNLERRELTNVVKCLESERVLCCSRCRDIEEEIKELQLQLVLVAVECKMDQIRQRKNSSLSA